MATASCETCGKAVEMKWFVERVRRQIKDIYNMDREAPTTSTAIACPHCKALTVKPSTVLYGRPLPPSFTKAIKEDFPDQVDLVVVIGTSLTVSPANGVPAAASETTPRVVINMEPVGNDLGMKYCKEGIERRCSRLGRDFFLPGAADEAVARLSTALGWGSNAKQ